MKMRHPSVRPCYLSIEMMSKETMERIGEQIKFLEDIYLLLESKHPQLFDEIPRKYREGFKRWLSEEKQEDRPELRERAWLKYHKEFVRYLVGTEIKGLQTRILNAQNEILELIISLGGDDEKGSRFEATG